MPVGYINFHESMKVRHLLKTILLIRLISLSKTSLNFLYYLWSYSWCQIFGKSLSMYVLVFIVNLIFYISTILVSSILVFLVLAACSYIYLFRLRSKLSRVVVTLIYKIHNFDRYSIIISRVF